MSKPAVFISYSQSDRGWAQEFVKSLQDRGLSVWSDQNIRAGDLLLPALEKGLRESSVFVFLITPDTLRRQNLFFEIGAAFAMGKSVVPILSADVDPSELPPPLRVRKHLTRESPEATAEQFVLQTLEPDRRA